MSVLSHLPPLMVAIDESREGIKDQYSSLIYSDYLGDAQPHSRESPAFGKTFQTDLLEVSEVKEG